MDASSAHIDRLQVERFHVDYVVPAAHPNPQQVKDRLEAVVARRLANALGEALGSWFATGDESIWLIRRLDVQLDVNAAWPRDQLARQWTAQLARSLAHVLQDESAAGVIRFPNRAAYLARFLADLVEGRAWQKWYYGRFAGLRLLPVSAAVRTVVCEDPALGMDALFSLSETSFRRAVETLTAQDARRTLDGLSAGGRGGEPSRDVEIAWAAWRREGGFPFLHYEPHTALYLYLRACRGHPERAGPGLRDAARALVRLERRLTEDDRGERLLDALAARDLSALHQVAGAKDAGLLRPLQPLPAEQVRAIGRGLHARHDTVDRDTLLSSTGPSTRFGGVFLLLPLLDAMPFHEAAHGWPDAGATPASALLRLFMLMKCLAPGRAHSFFCDPLVRDVVGVHPDLELEEARRWLSRLSRNRLEGLLTAVAGWHDAQEAVAGEALALVRAPLPGAPAGVLLDLRRGIWLGAWGYPPRRPDRLARRVRAWLRKTGYAPALIVGDAAFVDALHAAFPEAAVHAHEGGTVDALGTRDDVRAALRSHLPRAGFDLRYLSVPNALCGSRRADLMLSVAAQGVMRAFAWRLPGFSASSLPYLLANFLDVSGTIEDEPARRVVRLGRPPLQYVLGLTGMARRTYRLGWLDERPFTLFPEHGD